MACTLILASCKKDDNTNNNANHLDSNGIDTTKFYLSANIDGVASYTDSTHLSQNQNSYYFLEAQKLSTTNLTLLVDDSISQTEWYIYINNYQGSGVYNIGEANGAEYNLGTTTFGTDSVHTGTITVTSDNGSVVEGVFQFDGIDQNSPTIKHITNGKFRLPAVY